MKAIRINEKNPEINDFENKQNKTKPNEKNLRIKFEIYQNNGKKD